ncbi:MAG: glycosyltransferase family 4 protein [Proteobacteria bacterium]|nr:glycosyltransferase family 4 protein [Pseudomonadota bacterium]
MSGNFSYSTSPAFFNASWQQRSILERAVAPLEAGEGDRAKRILSELRPQSIGSAEEARIATEMLLDVHSLDAALDAAQRAAELDPHHPDTIDLLAECRYRIDLPKTRQADAEAVRAALDRVNACASVAQPGPDRRIHIVCKLDTLGGTERRALNLARLLSSHVNVTLWSTHPAHPMHALQHDIRLISPDAAPSGGTLAVIGTYFPCGDWLERAPFERVIVCHNLVEQSRRLIERLEQIEKNPAHPEVRLTFPSRMFREMYRLPGLVEYSPVDLDYFHRAAAYSDRTSDLAIGRHGRAFSLKYHPNSAAFFRVLLKRGYRVRLLGGAPIERTFANDTGAKPEFLAVGALDSRDFLADLDIFVYRKHPQWVETGGSVILEAMAMELPVVVFPEDCGCAELIVHGENGFLASSEAEAFDLIERLRADPTLRRRIGAAARQTLIDLQAQQESEIIEYYGNPPKSS